MPLIESNSYDRLDKLRLTPFNPLVHSENHRCPLFPDQAVIGSHLPEFDFAPFTVRRVAGRLVLLARYVGEVSEEILEKV
jgi:hypothetical protein